MTTIFDNGSFWIESLAGTAILPAAIGLTNLDLSLIKPGRLVGFSISIAADGSQIDTGNIRLHIQTPAVLDYAYGVQCNTVRIIVENEAAVAHNVTIVVVLFLKN